MTDHLAIWGWEAMLQQFAQGQCNEHIYWAIAAQMVEQEHSKMWQQCHTEVNALCWQFHAMHDANLCSGVG